MTEVSVIVPTLKSRDELECLPPLERDDFSDFEVIVRDDESATKARNEGIKRASADKLVFLDDDSRPRKGYLERAASVLDREAAVAGKIVHPRDDVFARHFTAHYSRGDEPTYVDYFWGCNMALRREVLEEVGAWNERIEWGHEEKELADRVRTSYDIYYDPELVVDHCYATSPMDFWRKRYNLETETPRYWDTRGVPDATQWRRILGHLFNPINYLGYTPKHLVVRAGGTLAGGAGRIRGMMAKE
jgi:GT2 family glycosyltransferase